MSLHHDAPAGFTPFYDSAGGVRYLWRTNPDGSHDIAAQQDVDSILDLNKAMFNENDGRSKTRDFYRIGSLPWIIWYKWLSEEGWDAMDPACADRLMRKLNDSDYRFLRTASGHLGPTQDGGFR